MLDTVSSHEVEIYETYQAMGFEMFVLLVTFLFKRLPVHC